MDSDDPCVPRTLATGRVGRVERCEHGTVHLTLGALTVRLTDDQLCALADTLAIARERVGEPAVLEQPARVLC